MSKYPQPVPVDEDDRDLLSKSLDMRTGVEMRAGQVRAMGRREGRWMGRGVSWEPREGTPFWRSSRPTGSGLPESNSRLRKKAVAS